MKKPDPDDICFGRLARIGLLLLAVVTAAAPARDDIEREVLETGNRATDRWQLASTFDVTLAPTRRPGETFSKISAKESGAPGVVASTGSVDALIMPTERDCHSRPGCWSPTPARADDGDSGRRREPATKTWDLIHGHECVRGPVPAVLQMTRRSLFRVTRLPPARGVTRAASITFPDGGLGADFWRPSVQVLQTAVSRSVRGRLTVSRAIDPGP